MKTHEIWKFGMSIEISWSDLWLGVLLVILMDGYLSHQNHLGYLFPLNEDVV